jgi:acetyl-CoA carboxylase, biotin carboxylase subunit
VSHFHAPGGPGIRVDSHLYSGYKVPPYYDSLLAKIISYGEDRQIAVARMQNALDETVIEGIKSNVHLHQDIIRDCNFIAGGTNIHYLEEKLLHK